MYDPHEIERRWHKLWDEHGVFEPIVEDRPKFFITVPYPYLNGNLHAGHTRTFTIGDVVARYKRMCGYNVLFPMGFHVTGTPIVGLSELIRNRDPEIMQVYERYHGIPKDVLYTLDTPEKIVDYFKKEAEKAMRSIGFSIDWRRKFTTMDEHYKAFIRWQFELLRKKGYVAKGSHPVRWCPNDGNPVEDHDILRGEDATIVEYVLIKFRLKDGTVLPCATLRPETVFGVTNLWINPDLTYVRASVKSPEGEDEEWVVSEEAFEKLRYTERQLARIGEVRGSEFVGSEVKNPITGNEVVVLPATFVHPDEGTGVVMSVPAHAPYDHLALQDLADADLSEYGIENPIKSIRYISLISVPEYGEYPAVEACEQMGVKDQHDPAAEEATRLVYRREFHNGVLKEVCGRYAGMAVSEVKDVLTRDFLDEGHAELFYDFSERPVVCRCGTRCVVKMVRGQWFLTYSNPKWKQSALECLAQMKIIPPEMRVEFENKIDWLKDKACARRKGLGTNLPWDEEWLIESLADSTIYMAYYIIVRLKERGVGAKELTKPVLDYILLGDESALEHIPEQHRAAVKAAREEFEYWYPVDLRTSGKDLVANHLLFFIFHHVAIFPKDKWPRAIAVNGFVSLEGQKMSKSKGPLLTLKRAVEEHGADTTRLYILSNAEHMQDADWKSENVEVMGRHLQRFFEWAREIIASHPQRSAGTRLDRWMLSRLSRHVREVRDALEALQTRRALQHAFFLLLNDVRWYERRGGRSELFTVVDTMVRMMAPFTPHVCEELWSMYHEKGNFVSLAPYPQPHPEYVDEEAEFCELLVRDVLDDITNILKVAKIEKPRRVCLYTAEDWSYTVLKEVLAHRNSLDMGQLMKRLSLDESVKPHMKEAASYLKSLAKDIHSMEELKLSGYVNTGWNRKAERELLEETSKFLSRELGLEVVVDPPKSEPKAALARPMRPAIIIE